MLENRYEIRRIIGLGGMSTVYAARDLRFGQVERICAIKEMVDADPDPGTRALRLVNFERESALLATIAHAAVPKIYDYFSYGGLVYLVLEYVDGQDLERALQLRNEPFPERDIIRWATEICSVLRMLHNYQPDPIIFRDLKPSNIMLRSSGQIALIDFGIARVFQGRQRGTMIGTEGYAPPEQYRGIADARGDIYALGATLHHLATNSDPRQETPFTFHERPVQTFNPNVTDEFASIISKMVAYHPDKRFQTVEELEAALEKLLYRGDGSRAEPERPASGSAEPQTQLPQTTVFTNPAPTQARFERRRSSRKRASRRQDPSTIERLAWSVDTGDEVRGSAMYNGKTVLIGSYDNTLYSIDPDDGSVRWKFRAGQGIVARPAQYNDLVVVGSEDSSLYGVNGSEGRLIWSNRTRMAIRSSAAIAGTKAIIGSDDASIYAFDCRNGEQVWRQRVWGPVRSSALIADDRAYIGSDDGSLYAVSIADGSTAWRQPVGGPVRSMPVLNGSQIIVSNWHGGVVALNMKDGSREWRQELETTVAASPSIRGGVIVIGLADGALIGLNATDGSKKWEIRYANQITATALLGRERGYVGTVDGDCLSFSIETGEFLWKHKVGGPIVSSPTFAGEHLVMGSLDCNVYGLALLGEEVSDLQEG